MPAASLVLVFVLVPILIVVFILIPVIILVFFVFILLLILLGFGFGPAFRRDGLLEIHLMPGFDVDFLDIPVDIFDFDEFGVLINRQHAKRLLFFHVLVPLAGCRFVISAHRFGPRGLNC